MFVISPVSALHSYASCRPTARDRYLAAIAQAQAEYARDQALEQQRAREAYARRQREQQLTKQLILDALYAQANEYDGVCPMGFNKPWAYTRYAREHAERLARERQVALEQACLARGRRNQDRIPQTINMSACHQKDEPVSSTNQSDVDADLDVAEQTQKPESAQDSLKKQLEEQLEARLMEEYESDMRETVQSLMKHVSESSVAASTEEVTTIAQPIPDTKGKTKQASFDISAPSDSETESDSEPTMDPSAIQRSLSAISEIEASFRALEADFVFPTELDFTHSSDGGLKLSYSSRNAPVRFYDDALSQLLSRLDGVASYGSREIRDARKKLVRTVSRSLEEVEKEVERRRVAVIARDLEAGRTTVSEPESPPVDMDSTAIADTTEAPATPRPDAIHSATEAVSVAEPHEAPSDAAVGPDSELAQDAAVTQNSFDGVAPLIATPTTNNQVLTASDSSGTTTLGVDNSSPTSSESILPVASEIPADIAPPSNLPHEAAEHVLMGTSEPSSPLTQTSVLSSSSPTPSTFLNSEDDVVLVDEDAWSEVEA